MRMDELDRAKENVKEEFKALNDKIHNIRRNSNRSSGTIEATMTIAKYNLQLQELISTLELLDKYKELGGK
jgi:hypothetical protein